MSVSLQLKRKKKKTFPYDQFIVFTMMRVLQYGIVENRIYTYLQSVRDEH